VQWRLNAAHATCSGVFLTNDSHFRLVGYQTTSRPCELGGTPMLRDRRCIVLRHAVSTQDYWRMPWMLSARCHLRQRQSPKATVSLLYT
jgi:hypothetical protein